MDIWQMANVQCGFFIHLQRQDLVFFPLFGDIVPGVCR